MKCTGFAPVIDENSSMLLLGSMPGEQSLTKQQYYGNPRNDFWKLLAALYQEEIPDRYEERMEWVNSLGIALWDVLAACERAGSLDSNIREAVSNDFEELFSRYPRIRTVLFNGAAAEKLFNRYTANAAQLKADRTFIRLPSSSPANAIGWQRKLTAWRELWPRIPE
ncbi:DNA-deoxyinosine glycosylase [Paenibacillus lutrae]|uniref:DNA-deoxyinosine glycosylase n=1 Tax=Paenibacillus lutrae TaxID=2078573 RepID=A0A7X3FED2_9BACL|nr:DNA-deoxyinosine glycosylase [Paenibacillus lutrae]